MEAPLSRITRRRLFEYGAAAGASIALPGRFLDDGRAAMVARKKPKTPAQILDPILDPSQIDKYVSPPVVPPAMPRTARLHRRGRVVDYYAIGVRQFVQQILPPGMP